MLDEVEALEEAVALMEESSCGVDPERARGSCFNESYRFVQILEAYGIGAEVISGLQVMKDGTSFLAMNGHAAVRIGGTVYDWTARQFYPHDQDFPLVQPIEEWRETWPELKLGAKT